MTPKITVVIPASDDQDALHEALAGLARQTISPDEILVVEAGDTRVSTAMVDLGVQVLSVGRALPGRARNIGARAASNDWVAFLDAGTTPLPTWLEALCRGAAGHLAADILYGSYEPRIHDDWDWAAVATYIAVPNTADGARGPTSASMCVRRTSWERLGGMREDLRAGEDLLFFEAIAGSDYQAVNVPEAKVLWDLPTGLSGHFRRLRLYSFATWKTKLARKWQVPVIRMYLVGAALAFLAIAVHPSFLVLLMALASTRLARNVAHRHAGLPGPLSLRRILRLPVILLAADLATLVGSLEGAIQHVRWRGPAGAPR